MENVISRLNRYAAALPADEPLPIGGEVEKFELALHAVMTSRYHDPAKERELLSQMLDSINAGSFQFRGHRVVVV